MVTRMNERTQLCMWIKHVYTKEEKKRERKNRGTWTETERASPAFFSSGVMSCLEVSAYVDTLGNMEQLACPYTADGNVP